MEDVVKDEVGSGGFGGGLNEMDRYGDSSSLCTKKEPKKVMKYPEKDR